MLKKLYYYLNYIWRIAMTGEFFLFFSVGAIFLVYVIIPIVGRRNAQPTISAAFRFFTFAAQKLGIARFEFSRIKKLQSDRGCIIVSNHPTLIDYVIIISRLKRCNTIVKESLWDNPFFKKLIQTAGYIPNKKFAEIFPLVESSLRAGENILIFPEGTRTTPDQQYQQQHHEPPTLKLQRGAAQIAIRTGAPVRILKITCTPSTLAKGERWYNIPKKCPLFTVEVGELIDSRKFLRDTGSPSLAARRLTEYLQKILTN